MEKAIKDILGARGIIGAIVYGLLGLVAGAIGGGVLGIFTIFSPVGGPTAIVISGLWGFIVGAVAGTIAWALPSGSSGIFAGVLGGAVLGAIVGAVSNAPLTLDWSVAIGAAVGLIIGALSGAIGPTTEGLRARLKKQ